MTTETTGREGCSPTRGQRDAYVMLHARNWRIYTGEPETESQRKDHFYAVSLIRDDHGGWMVTAMPEKDSDHFLDILDVDDPGAVAFLDTFAELMFNPPPRGKYRWSELGTS